MCRFCVSTLFPAQKVKINAKSNKIASNAAWKLGNSELAAIVKSVAFYLKIVKSCNKESKKALIAGLGATHTHHSQTWKVHSLTLLVLAVNQPFSRYSNFFHHTRMLWVAISLEKACLFFLPNLPPINYKLGRICLMLVTTMGSIPVPFVFFQTKHFFFNITVPCS